MDRRILWQRYNERLCGCAAVGLRLDTSRMDFDDGFLERMAPAMARSFQAMRQLEAGAIANPDEGRMVGHYWLRAAELAPEPAIRNEIRQTLAAIETFTDRVHSHGIVPPRADAFTDLLLIGIGGSALGPQLVAAALGTGTDRMRFGLLDNTDPDGIDDVLASLEPNLPGTLVLVISKSGGTRETRNGMLEVEHAFAARGLDFAAQAVAITGAGSALDRRADAGGWLARFPMWDWVGGRTSVTSAVGLLPAALQGIDIRSLLEGAAAMDRCTRQDEAAANPAAMLALMWYHATDGCGRRDMVVLPYKDRLLLLSRYLQQLIMESIGKRHDVDGNVVHQGITVYGNKGSTDQHAYVQQLREGVANFFATFIVVLQDRDSARAAAAPQVDPDVTSGDYLSGFWQGTRDALHEMGRQSITIMMDRLDARSLGALIALYERAVGYYATLVNINAYHQPGVEAGKQAAESVLALQTRVLAHVRGLSDPAGADAIAHALGCPDQAETVHHILEHLAANDRGVLREATGFHGTEPRAACA